MAVNAIYKRYDGTSWVEYHFATNAGQVSTTSARKFVTSSVTVNGVGFTMGSNDAASVTINGTHITGNASAVSGSSLQYISARDTIAVALGKLDKATKDAYDAVPSGVLTTSNYSTTLGSVYQPLDSDLTAIAALSGSGLLRRNSTGTTWELVPDAYVTQNTTINDKQLTGNITLTGYDISIGGSGTGSSDTLSTRILSLGSSVSSLNEAFESFEYGATRSYAIDNTVTGNNTQFDSTDDDIIFTLTESQFNSGGITTLDGDVIGFSNMHVGDSVFVKQTNVPDRWVSQIINTSLVHSVTFSKLESYNMSWGAIQGKPTTLSGYGITDCSINNSTGAISIGGVTKTPLYAHQDISGKAPNNHAVDANTYGLGTSSVYGHVKLVSGDLNGKSAADGMAASQSHTHSQYLTAHQSLSGYATESWVNTNYQKKVSVGSSAPSSPATGDIWIATA